MTRCGEPRELPASIDLSAYRIIQEALTNVVKHARTSSCQVLIGYRHDELILEVTDNGAGQPELAGAGVSHHGAVTGYGAGNLFGGGVTVLDARQAGSAPGWILSDGPRLTAGLVRAPAGPAARSAGSAAPSAGAGTASSGCANACALLGGEFSAGPRPGYGFQVSAHIPLPAAPGSGA